MVYRKPYADKLSYVIEARARQQQRLKIYISFMVM